MHNPPREQPGRSNLCGQRCSRRGTNPGEGELTGPPPVYLSANLCTRRRQASFLPGSARGLHGTGRSEPKRPSWARSGTAKQRWEPLRGEDQLRAASCKRQLAAAPVWVSWALSAQNFVVSCTYCICPNRNTLLQE